MNSSKILRCVIAVALCLGLASRAEEVGPLTNVGELPFSKIADVCTKVFEIGEQHQERRRIVSALDSFAWIMVNLPFAPKTDALNKKNAEAFVSTLESAKHGDISVFGRERAIRYLDRMISDAILSQAIKKRAQNLKDIFSKTSGAKIKAGSNEGEQ